MLQKMSNDVSWLEQILTLFNVLQGIPPLSRHVFFVMWLLAGAIVFYGVPLLRLAGTETKPKVGPSTPSLQNIQAGGANSPQKNVNVAPVQAADADLKILTAPVQVADSRAEKVISAPTEANNTNSENVITGPIQVDNLSNKSSGDVQATVGSNVQAPKELRTGLYTQNVGGTVNIYIGNSAAAIEKSTIKVTEDLGGSAGSAEIEIYTLFNSASWAYKSSSQLLTYKDQKLTLEEFLVSDGFMTEVKTYQAIVCLGLASGVARGELAQTVALSDERATHLCGLVSRKIYPTSEATKVFGLPLGYHQKEVKAQTREEKQQRSVVILGIKAASGTLESEEHLHSVITEILKNDGFGQLKSSDYSEVSSGKRLRYLRIERGIYSAR
jgi:hypothetical protein